MNLETYITLGLIAAWGLVPIVGLLVAYAIDCGHSFVTRGGKLGWSVRWLKLVRCYGERESGGMNYDAVLGLLGVKHFIVGFIVFWATSLACRSYGLDVPLFASLKLTVGLIVLLFAARYLYGIAGWIRKIAKVAHSHKSKTGVTPLKTDEPGFFE